MNCEQKDCSQCDSIIKKWQVIMLQNQKTRPQRFKQWIKTNDYDEAHKTIQIEFIGKV